MRGVPPRRAEPLVRRGRHRRASGPLDPLDVAILSALREDGRASLRRVARIVGASVTTVSSRVRGLERLGVLEGFVPLVSVRRLAAVGRGPHCVVLHVSPRDRSRGAIELLARAIAREPAVCYLFQMSDSSDLMALASTPDPAASAELLRTVAEVPGVARVRSVSILEVFKERPGHPVGPEQVARIRLDPVVDD
jgi:DNA-binding Lrp family transcriptional regulator